MKFGMDIVLVQFDRNSVIFNTLQSVIRTPRKREFLRWLRYQRHLHCSFEMMHGKSGWKIRN
jgi:hypothetical protein